MSSVPEKAPPTLERAGNVPWSVATVKANLLAYLRFLQSSPAMSFSSDNGVLNWSCSVPHSWLNGVLVSRPPAANERALINESMTRLRAAGACAASWWIDTSASARDWEPQLRRCGWRPDWSTPAMILELRTASWTTGTDPRLEIREVLDTGGLVDWTRTMVAGFGLPVTWEGAILRLFGGLRFGRPLRHWVGYSDGSPVAIASLFEGAGVAGLQYVATVPERRGRGIGAAMASYALKAALEQGHTAAVLESSELGYNLYLKLGFRMVGPLDYFYWER